MRCKFDHKTQNDHSFVRDDGRRVWICSHCQRRGLWDENWSYFGTVECSGGAYGMLGCGWAKMEWVACSRDCAIALGGPNLSRVEEHP